MTIYNDAINSKRMHDFDIVPVLEMSAVLNVSHRLDLYSAFNLTSIHSISQNPMISPLQHPCVVEEAMDIYVTI